MTTAIEKLRELREHDSSIVAIAKDRDGEVWYYSGGNPYVNEISQWWSTEHEAHKIKESIKFDSDSWMKCIVTYKDLEGYEVESITISKSEYDRLLACESKLNEIMKIIEK